MKSIRIIFILAGLLILGSCRSSKEPAEVSDFGTASLEQRFDSLVARCGDWQQINVPVSIELRQPTSLSASGRAYMRHGEDIYISLKFLGFEVGTLYVNNDSIFVADKINKQYIAEPISMILSDASISISDIQDILVGRAFVNDKGTISRSALREVKLSPGKDAWTITPKNKIAGASYSFDIDNSTNLIRSLNVEREGQRVSCIYANAATTQRGIFMSRAGIATEIKNRKIDASLQWSWQNVKWNVGESVKWRQPKGYRRIDPSKFTKMFE